MSWDPGEHAIEVTRTPAPGVARSLWRTFAATLPRLRYDQLMAFGWKILLPLATLNALVTAILVTA